MNSPRKIQFKIRFVGLMALMHVLAACGPVGSPVQNFNGDDPRIFTGGMKSDSAANQHEEHYTTAGQINEFDRIRLEVQPHLDKNLSPLIADVRVTKNTNTKIEVEVTVKNNSHAIPEKLIFSGNADQKDTQKDTQKDIGELTRPQEYRLDIRCIQSCHTYDLRIRRYAKSSDSQSRGALIGETGILYAVTQPTVSIEKPRDTIDFKSESLRSLTEMGLKPTSPFEQTSVTVVGGPSFSRLISPQQLKVETPLLDTAHASVAVSSFELFGQKTNENLETSLVGIDPHSGSMMLEVHSKETNEKAQIRVEAKAPSPEQSSPANPAPIRHTQEQGPRASLFQVRYDPAILPLTAHTTDNFLKYEDDAETKRMIQVWLTPEPSKTPHCARGNFGRNKLLKFLRQAPLVAEHLEEITEKIDVSPEMGYLLALESDFLTDERFPYTDVGKYIVHDDNGQRQTRYSQALGPWQIMTDTATHIKNLTKENFIIHRTNGSRPGSDADDRTYFKQSTYMSASYFKYLVTRFSKDPATAVLAYHAGPGTASGAQSRTQRYEEFDISLSDILRFRTQTRTNCQHINYAYAFLALRSIGQNLGAYDLANIPILQTEAHLSRISRPDGPLPKDSQ